MTDRPACNVQPGDVLTGRCACSHRVGAHSPAPGGPVCNVCVADDNKTLTAEITRLRAGADPTPPDEAAQLTPGQLWHRLTTTDPDDRRRCLEHITEDLDTAWNCRANAHDTTVTELRVAALRVGDLTAALREIVNTLGPDGTAPCDCDDRALANEAAEALRIAREALTAEVQGG